MRHFNIKNPTAYFAFAVVIVFVLLKYSVLPIVPEMVESIIPFAPLLTVLMMAFWAFHKSQKGESAKNLLPLTLKYQPWPEECREKEQKKYTMKL